MPIHWRALYIDDDPDYIKLISETLDGIKILEPDHKLTIETTENFNEAFTLIEDKRYDLVIIDVLDDSTEKEEGVRILESIKSRRFLPVFFYTAYPGKVEALSSELIKVIDKKDGEEKLLEAIKDIFDKRLPIVNRALITHVEDIQRQYMWDFVAKNWDEFGASVDNAELAILLARRLSVTLCRENIGKLVSAIDSGMKYNLLPGKAHPVEYYLMPPVDEDAFMTGDIFIDIEGESKRYKILLNPCCDFVRDNVELALFSNCSLLEKEPEYIDLKSDPENTGNKGKLKSLIKDRRYGKQQERFLFLPKAFSIPDIIVDFQRLTILELSTLKEMCSNGDCTRIASLDSPFAEALTTQFSQYYGRIGKPDIRDELVLERIMRNIRAS